MAKCSLNSTKYEKEKLIGSGTYGNVWLVRSKHSRISHVLKEINLKPLDASEQQQALTEVAILSKCKHRNIIRYKEAMIEQDKGTLSIIMEYADGGDLYTAIMRQKGIPFKEPCIILWFIQISLALQYIHYQNILHRDLKTQNIFLTRNKIIKVGDFGIARFLHEPQDLATTAIGTPYYLSPEICQRRPYNYKSDIWALGCVLFEMSTLGHPFKARNFSHLVSLILSGKRRDFPRHCSRLIQDLVNSMLNFDPEKRPSTTEILATPALQPYLSQYLDTLNFKGPESLSRVSVPNECCRRYSTNDVYSSAAENGVKRRASISSLNPKKICAGSQSGGSVEVQRQSLSKLVSSRAGSQSVCKSTGSSIPKSYLLRNTRKPSPLADIGNERSQSRLTYKISKMLDKKKSLPKVMPSNTYMLVEKLSSCNEEEPEKSKNSLEIPNNGTDQGYQSEETRSISPGKAPDVTSAVFSNVIPTTEDSSNTCDSVIQSSEGNDDVFAQAIRNKVIKERTESKIDVKSGHTLCQHSSRCHQCVLGMLWKNRIRRNDDIYVDVDERSSLRSKLRSVFKGELYGAVYQALILNWEGNEREFIRVSFESLLSSLNYDQTQHLPLMMQLIQLDLLKKSNSACS